MSLLKYLKSAVLGIALASCGPKDSFNDDDEEQETLEVRVQTDTTDEKGYAFDGSKEILVKDGNSPVPNEEVTLYNVLTRGDAYLTEANGGGIALFPETRRRHGGNTGRELEVNVHQQIRESEQELLQGLLQWAYRDEFICRQYSRDDVPEGTAPHIVYYSSGRERYVVFAGSFRQVFEKSEHERFYALQAERNRIPLFIPDDLARELFDNAFYERLQKECSSSSGATCSGEVLFEDEFEGKELDLERWDLSDGLPCGADAYRLNNGILELNPPRASCILQSRSRYSLADGPLCFEARWRVREREGTGFVVDLYNINDLGTIGFVERESGLSCFVTVPNNTNLETCDAQTTNFHTTRLKASEKEINFYIDNKLQQTLPLPSLAPDYLIDLSCSSRDNSEKLCLIEYVRLER